MPGGHRIRAGRRTCTLAVATFAAALALPAGALEATPAKVIDAEVVSVVPIRTPGRGLPWRARVTVQLDAGTQHRLTYNRPHPRVGERVQLQLANGELRPVRPLR